MLDCLLSFLSPSHHRSPVQYDLVALVRYDVILWLWRLSCVRYDLVLVFLYDIHLRAITTTILSIRGVKIPIDLVSSATDSIRRRIVLFKLVPILTSCHDKDLQTDFYLFSVLILES